MKINRSKIVALLSKKIVCKPSLYYLAYNYKQQEYILKLKGIFICGNYITLEEAEDMVKILKEANN